MYRVIKPFKIYLDGINPTEFGEGLHDLPERAAEIAVSEGWAEKTVVEENTEPPVEEPPVEEPPVEEPPVEEPPVEDATKRRGKK